MTSRLLIFTALLTLSVSSSFAQASRSGTDFELESLQKKLRTTRDALDLVSIHLNLGDVYTSRRESRLAAESYEMAQATAAQLRSRSRRESHLTLYATATAYEGLAFAKLGKTRESFDRFEEALRFLGDSPKIWNLYSGAMLLDGRPEKAKFLALSAVRLAAEEAAKTSSPRAHLDLEIYRYALASAQAASNDTREAVDTLEAVSSKLDSRTFSPIRAAVEREEKFEIYSSVRGDADAFVSLFNRVHLRIGKLREERGEILLAREAYEKVLELRSDDRTALSALARLPGENDRAASFARAFDADPSSLDLILAYRRHLASGGRPSATSANRGGEVRRVIEELALGRHRDADERSKALLTQRPADEGARFLRAFVLIETGSVSDARKISEALPSQSRERKQLERMLESVVAPSLDFLEAASTSHVPSSDELLAVLRALRDDEISAEQNRRLDVLSFRSQIVLPPIAADSTETELTSGVIEQVAFTFGRPIRFAGRFESQATLEYKIVGATVVDGRDALLLEPLTLRSAGFQPAVHELPARAATPSGATP